MICYSLRLGFLVLFCCCFWMIYYCQLFGNSFVVVIYLQRTLFCFVSTTIFIAVLMAFQWHSNFQAIIIIIMSSSSSCSSGCWWQLLHKSLVFLLLFCFYYFCIADSFWMHFLLCIFIFFFFDTSSDYLLPVCAKFLVFLKIWSP